MNERTNDREDVGKGVKEERMFGKDSNELKGSELARGRGGGFEHERRKHRFPEN